MPSLFPAVSVPSFLCCSTCLNHMAHVRLYKQWRWLPRGMRDLCFSISTGRGRAVATGDLDTLACCFAGRVRDATSACAICAYLTRTKPRLIPTIQAY